jgi:hypothetical protein
MALGIAPGAILGSVLVDNIAIGIARGVVVGAGVGVEHATTNPNWAAST